MQLVALADSNLREELLSFQTFPDLQILWIENFEDFSQHPGADAFMDLLFEYESRRLIVLESLLPKPVIVNSVVHALKDSGKQFVRINGWPGFLKRPVVEASCNNQEIRAKAERIFSFLSRKTEWVNSEPGFVTARIISMIINEAYFALEEGVSTKEEIDTAMKLGTNYPYGPFEWASRIGKRKIYLLLQELSLINSRYDPAGTLQTEATN